VWQSRRLARKIERAYMKRFGALKGERNPNAFKL
jgi:hypothetical protein